MKLTDEMISVLKENGGSRWTKGGHDRVYLNSFAEKAVGLDVSRYNTGNVCYAELDGEKISNCQAKKILSALDGIYLDVETGALHWYGRGDRFYIQKAQDYIDGLLGVTDGE